MTPIPPISEEEYEQLQWELEREQKIALFAAKIGPSFGYRREPRIRFRIGRKGFFDIYGVPNKTRRAAFRQARAFREKSKRTMAFVVFKYNGKWVVGNRKKKK